MKRLLLTGANRGLGRALSEELLRAQSYQLSLVTRNADRQRELQAQLGPAVCDYLTGDQASPAFAKEICAQLRARGQRLDVLFLNAASMTKGGDAEALLRVNFSANVELVDRCLAEGLLRAQARIVLVSSELGNFRMLRDASARERLARATTVEQLSALAGEYAESLRRGEPWQSRVANAPEYTFTKLLLSLAARILARDPRVQAGQMCVHAVCPGWTRTEMGGAGASQSVAQGLAFFSQLLALPAQAAAEGQGRLYSRGQFVDVLDGLRPAR